MITLVPDEEQREIAKSVSDFLEKSVTIATVREQSLTPDGVSEDLWASYADLGWLALGVPEEVGGVGLGVAEEMLLFVELGRRLAPGPLRTTILAARIAAAAGREDLVAELVSGERRAGIAVGDLVVDARPGDLLVVLTETTGSLVEVAATEPVDGVDPTTRVARATRGATAVDVDGPFLTIARIHAAAELLGVIEAVRDMSAFYAQTRQQFGVPIGTFQAVKHRCADMAVAAYAVRSQVAFAAVKFDAGEPDASFQAASAYALAARHAQKSTADNIQNHGGIGFTWEQDSHLFLKRAHLLSRLLGVLRDTYEVVLEPPRNDFI
ncbi:acyl-CoA dehydrogenase family protein [Microbacterium sp. B19]|uniref:acyl-CoA dehydrogenase family protein n=1 Tax=Microbacterium sp. B19 TaxID=96765 RepID=UPI0003474183|nr:acyl-CoA dehydrogenase family protein [Microbacterium sp. B19]